MAGLSAYHMCVRSVCNWLLIALGAAALACILPGSAVSGAPLVGPVAAIEAPLPSEGGIACAVVACGHVSTSASGALPAVVVIGMIAGLSLCIPVSRARRRLSSKSLPLPAGVFEQILHPPQALRLA